MSNIKNWSTTPSSNNSAPPAGAPEGMAPSTVNDIMRQQMADHKTQWQDAEWFDWGHTPTRLNATQFTVSTDLTTAYLVGRRLKLYDSSTLYATVTAASYSAPNTTITVGTDSGSLTASLTSVALAIISPTNLSLPASSGFKGATIASASTTDLSTATGDFVDVSGTVTITAFGTAAAGVVRTVRFTGALTLTHNGTSLILPGAVNITTVSGDTAIFRSLGSGNWICISYKASNGRNVTTGFKGADLASSGTVDLSTATGDFVDITGTTTITAFGTADAGIQRVVRFTGVLTLTHNATSLILPGGLSIVTADGDTAIFRSLGSGNWRCIVYTRANGQIRQTFGIKGTDIASAGTTDLSTATGAFVDVTGTTTITAFGTASAGTTVTVRFTGSLTLTHNATSLILPTGGNVITIAGDVATFVSLGSGNWVCVNYSSSAVGNAQLVLKNTTETATNDNTVSNDAALTFSMGANITYNIVIRVLASISATGDFQFDINGPASPSSITGGYTYTAIVDEATYSVNTIVQGSGSISAYASAVSVLAGVNSTIASLDIALTIVNGSNSGTFALRWAQNSSSGTGSSVLAGSWLTYKQG